jgi:hypothetical protein
MEQKVDPEVPEEQEICDKAPRLSARSRAGRTISVCSTRGGSGDGAAASGWQMLHLVLAVNEVGVQVQAQRCDDVQRARQRRHKCHRHVRPRDHRHLGVPVRVHLLWKELLHSAHRGGLPSAGHWLLRAQRSAGVPPSTLVETGRRRQSWAVASPRGLCARGASPQALALKLRLCWWLSSALPFASSSEHQQPGPVRALVRRRARVRPCVSVAACSMQGADSTDPDAIRAIA